MNKKIIFTTGGTGGHILPAINLMKHFSEKGFEVIIVTDERGKNFIKEYKEFKSYILKASTPTKKKFFNKILSFLIIFYSLIKSVIILKKEKVDLVLGLGGYVSFPISFTSKLFNLPLLIYENNVVLGRANRYLSLFSKKILTAKKINAGIKKKYQKKIYQVGPILHKDIININDIKDKKNIDEKKITILIIGGSQGAEVFGTVIPKVIKMIKDVGYIIEVYQQCTRPQKENIIQFYEENKIKNYIFEFDQNILKLILSSDLAITRCGASSTAELVHTMTPFIGVPLPNSIDNHQYLNAKYYENEGCCWILEQDNFNTKNLFNLIIETIRNKKKLKEVRECMKKSFSKNVYDDIEKHVKDLI